MQQQLLSLATLFLKKEVKVKKGVKDKVGLTLIDDATDLLKNDNVKKKYKLNVSNIISLENSVVK